MKTSGLSERLQATATTSRFSEIARSRLGGRAGAAALAAEQER